MCFCHAALFISVFLHEVKYTVSWFLRILPSSVTASIPFSIYSANAISLNLLFTPLETLAEVSRVTFSWLGFAFFLLNLPGCSSEQGPALLVSPLISFTELIQAGRSVWETWCNFSLLSFCGKLGIGKQMKILGLCCGNRAHLSCGNLFAAKK